VIAVVPRYTEYKDTGVTWAGDVPEHWEVRRIKTLFRERDERSGDGTRVLLSLTRARGIVPQADASNRMASAEDLSKYKICRPGDLVMNRMQAWSGMFGLSPIEGLVSPDYSVFEATGASEERYFEYLFKTPILVDEFARRSKGIGSGFNRLYTPDFGAVPISVPPLPEQTAIVRFLDHADRRIRRYIAAKKKLIALLDEQKQAVIHGAVTRGLNPNVRLKPSGVEWLGDVPEHWLVCPLKFLVPQVTVGIVVQPARLYADSGVPCLRSFNISSGVVTSRDLAFISPEANYANRKSQIFAGDVVVVRTGRAGIAAIVSPEFDGANCIDLLIVRKSKKILSDYLLTYLNSWPAKTDVKYRSVGAIQAHYNTATLANMVVATPPLGEQRQILDEIAPLVAVINASMTAADGQIALMREIRTRLIADVVTGKLDVRDAVGQLPDEIHEFESLDLDDALTEGEGSEGEADLNGAAEEAEA
jgi:type I restriction enzyme S subunit